jgi:hypothetical protein
MRFQVMRASNWDDDFVPCEGAVHDGDDWWIEIATLDDLLAFIAKNNTGNGIIIDQHSLLIYDDYIE